MICICDYGPIFKFEMKFGLLENEEFYVIITKAAHHIICSGLIRALCRRGMLREKETLGYVTAFAEWSHFSPLAASNYFIIHDCFQAGFTNTPPFPSQVHTIGWAINWQLQVTKTTKQYWKHYSIFISSRKPTYMTCTLKWIDESVWKKKLVTLTF